MKTSLLRLDLHTRKVCFSIATSQCCDDPVTEQKRFKVEVIREGDDNEQCYITYPIFEMSKDGDLCIVLDSSMSKLCAGRYLFKIIFDDCTTIDVVRFQWGGKPVLTAVSCESSSLDDCFESGCEDGSAKIPDSCCDIECEECPPPCENPTEKCFQ